MNLPFFLLLFSSVSFIFYGLSCLFLPGLRAEFTRYGLANMRRLTGFLELAGAAGLLVGLKVPVVGALAAGGLGVLMVLGFLVRMKIGDGLLRALPALTYALINLYLLLYLADGAYLN